MGAFLGSLGLLDKLSVLTLKNQHIGDVEVTAIAQRG